MKKIFKALTCLALGGVLAVSAAGCHNQSEHRDAESSPLRLAIGAVDQKFNPLFYTSQNDGTIANMTQVSLVTAELKGKDTVLAFGEDYPVATLDYKETYYSATGTQIGVGYGDGTVSGAGDKEGNTTYEFLIKNGMKFSDGVDLTVMDILFNLYVYLDPVYSGSNTMYSTKITGLQDYRQQVKGAGSGTNIDMSQYHAEAMERVNNLIQWSERPASNPKTELMEADLEEVKKEYEEELNTDWSATATGWVESYKEYRFTEAWQAFFFIEGLVGTLTEQNEYGTWVEKKDENGKYYTDLDVEAGDDQKKDLINMMEEAATSAKIDAFLADPENSGVSREDAKLALQKAVAVKHVYDAYTTDSQIQYILRYTATASTAYDYFVLDAMSKDRPAGELLVPRIEGISVHKTKEFNDKTYSDEHDVLKIKIDGIDPKARWNFGITIAPMHYYSDEEHTNLAMQDYEQGKIYEENGNTATHFGVEYRNIKWFSDVLASPDKNGKPVGAGPYQCSTNTFSTTGVTHLNFFKNNIAYFTRNENFTTMGAGIENAKIKNVQYKVYRDDKIVEALKTKEIDYGEPTATSDNQKELKKGTLKQLTYLTGGYGYIGINPKYVEDIEVRRAIMHALDTAYIREYYGTSLVNLINAPVSTTSWAYPKNSKRKYEQWTDTQQIKDLVAESGNWTYRESDKLFHNNLTGNPLKISFVIAGESTDHPAYAMMVDAKNFLNKCGFDITVETRVDALKKLTTGDLAVWAAAWSTSIDPDPYQIYSVNSNATSTKNWYKDGIMGDGTSKFAEERRLVNLIGEKIEEGRETLSQDQRADIYAECFDLIMELAVEFPTYQRSDLCVYNSAVIDGNTLNTAPSFVSGPISELWKLNYVK